MALNESSIKVKRELESGWFQWVELDLPASFSIQSGINTPRYASLKGIMAMKKKTLDKFSYGDFHSVSFEPKTHLDRMYIPQKSKETVFVDGSSAEISEKLAGIFANEIRVLG